MGYGDELIASGQARGAKARGKRIAFGNGQLILWHRFAFEIFDNNPNVAPPGSESAEDIEWVANHVGARPYNRDNKIERKWEFVPGQIKAPGEVFFKPEELDWAKRNAPTDPFVLVEPNVPKFKASAPNKQWPLDRYQDLTNRLRARGLKVVQFRYELPYGPGHALSGAQGVHAPSFRHALALLRHARLFLGPEGGLHHGAAAVDVPAVVLFGSYISPSVTGYAHHHNHYTGMQNGCGSYDMCEHCVQGMQRIKTDDVLASCEQALEERKD